MFTVDEKDKHLLFLYKAMRFADVLQLSEYLKQRALFTLSSFQAYLLSVYFSGHFSLLCLFLSRVCQFWGMNT